MSFGVLELDKVSIKLKQNFLALMSKGVFSEKKKYVGSNTFRIIKHGGV